MSTRYTIKLIGPKPSWRQRRKGKKRTSKGIQVTEGQYRGFVTWRDQWFEKVFSRGAWFGWSISTLGYGLWVWLVL